MLFGVKDELQIDLVSKNVTTRNCKEVKVLRITFDNKLNSSLHLTSITKKTNIKLNTLTRFQKYVTLEQKTFSSVSFMKSQFNYCPLICLYCLKEALHRLNNIHERFLCLIHQDYVSRFVTLLANATLIHQK